MAVPLSTTSISGSQTAFLQRRRNSTSVSNFIQKTYNILQEKKYESIVSWTDQKPQFHCLPGNLRAGSSRVSSFQIHNVKAFEEIVLPAYFKHSNLSSFVRQVPPRRCSSTCTTSIRCEEGRTSLSSSTTNSARTVPSYLCKSRGSKRRITAINQSPRLHSPTRKSEYPKCKLTTLMRLIRIAKKASLKSHKILLNLQKETERTMPLPRNQSI